MKTISTFLTKTFSDYSNAPGKLKVLLLAPTVVAAINIDGTTMHAGFFNKPIFCFGVKSKLQLEYSEVGFVIVDEISMVSNVTLLQIYRRLCGIFGCSKDQPFARKSALVVGDFLQLSLVKS